MKRAASPGKVSRRKANPRKANPRRASQTLAASRTTTTTSSRPIRRASNRSLTAASSRIPTIRAARSISRSHASKEGRLFVITLDPKLEDVIKAATERTERGSIVALSPAMVSRLGERLAQEISKLLKAGHEPVILCSPQVRAQVKKIADAVQPGIVVLSYNEIVQDVRVESLGMVAAE